METGNLTYQDIDKLEENLSNPEVRKLYTYDEMIIRLLCQVLRQNRYLADQIASADMRSRMAYNTMNKVEKTMKVGKMKDAIDFMLGLITGVKRGKQKNKRKIKGIQIGTRTDRE